MFKKSTDVLTDLAKQSMETLKVGLKNEIERLQQ